MVEQSHSIEMARVFRAPRDLVFRAWTDPALVGRWMLRGKCTDVEMDVCEGGAWRLTAEMPYGPAVAYGTYREIREPERLVLTFSWEQIPIGETVITVEFLEHDDGCEMRFRQELFPDEQTAGVHEQVWPKDFDLLEEVVGSAIAE